MSPSIFGPVVDIFASRCSASSRDSRDSRDSVDLQDDKEAPNARHDGGASAASIVVPDVPCVPAVPPVPVPSAYEHAYSDFIRTCPDAVEHDRWVMAKADANAFLVEFGSKAADAEWAPDEIFGLNPSAPMVRYDGMGLVWMLRGLTVVDIDATSAVLSNGPKFYRAFGNLKPNLRGE